MKDLEKELSQLQAEEVGMSKKGLTSVGVKWMHRRYVNYDEVTTWSFFCFPTTHSKAYDNFL